jgi:hypothetical protein
MSEFIRIRARIPLTSELPSEVRDLLIATACGHRTRFSVLVQEECAGRVFRLVEKPGPCRLCIRCAAKVVDGNSALHEFIDLLRPYIVKVPEHDLLPVGTWEQGSMCGMVSQYGNLCMVAPHFVSDDWFGRE